MTNVLLLGGPRSGKSTLVGGLIKHLTINNSGQDGYYEVVQEFDEGFESSVINRMENYNYPSRTSQHVVKITVQDTESLFFPRDEVMTVFDFGGEFQLDILGTNSGILDISVANRMNEEVSFGSPMNEQFIERLKKCKGIIFLMNLKTYMMADDTGFISPSTLESDLVEEKDKNALVVIATDLIDYFPDTPKDSVNTTTFNNTIYDEELFTRLNDTFHLPRMMATLRIVEDRDNFDLFGVSVPPGENEDTLARGGGTFQTEGFETLVRWILK